MKRILILLLCAISMSAMCPINAQASAVQPVAATDCVVQSFDHHALAGIQGEPLTIASEGNIQSSIPTHFSSGAKRVPFGKNRTRTAFLRKMIHHYQSVYLVFRGKERLETSPFATSAGCAYYVYGLRRILC